MTRRRKSTPAELYEREPPCNPEMEQEVLGCLLFWAQIFGGGSRKYIKDAIQTLEPEDFRDPMRRKVFQAIINGKHEVGTVGLAIDRLKRAKLWSQEELKVVDEQVDAAYLNGLMKSTALPPHLPYYCGCLRRLRIEREAQNIAWEIVISAYGADMVEWSQQTIERLEGLQAMAADNESRMRTIESQAAEVMAEFESKRPKNNGRNGELKDGEKTTPNSPV